MNAKPDNLPAERPKISYATVEMNAMGAGGMLAPRSLGEVVAFAQVMARADIALPKHLRGNDGACLSVAMQAMRWEMDPFAVANKSYSVNDRLAYEAQLCAAVVNMRAPIIGRPRYVYSGDGATRTCQVICQMIDGEEREYTSPQFQQITVKNSPLWKSDPDQQLGYFAIRSWARRHTPEVLLGVYTPDEVAAFRDDGARDVTPKGTGLRARQEARLAVGGFNADHVAAELHDAETGEVIETKVEEPKPAPPADDEARVDDGPSETTANADDFPGDRKEPEFDAIAWAAEINRTADLFTTLDELNGFTDDPANKDKFAALEKASPGIARSLGAAITGRRKALTDKAAQS